MLEKKTAFWMCRCFALDFDMLEVAFLEFADWTFGGLNIRNMRGKLTATESKESDVFSRRSLP